MSVEAQTLRFARPLQTAFGTLRERTLLNLRLTDADGRTGRGEAAALPPYDGVAIEDVRGALDAYRPLLEAGAGGSPRPNLLDACREAADLPQALAAVDLALWDLAGQRAGQPVVSLLADAPPDRVPVNATVGAADRAGAAAAAADWRRNGFRCVKLKVGTGDDAGRVAAVRAAVGPEVDLRLDANGAWTPEQAVRMIESLAPVGLELVEEPVHGIEAMRWVRERVAARIAMDETAAEPGALASGAADAVCLKVSACGGISGLLAAAALVRTWGGEPYLSSTFDGPVGLAGALHAAAALGSQGPLPPCGLATLGLFEGAVDPFPPSDGSIAVPTGPGLGLGDLG